MFLELLQFFAPRFLYLALHLETGSFPRPLTAKQERESFAAYRTGDLAARDKIIRHNLRLVAHVAKKYYAMPGEQDDLISIGTIGLIKAVNTYDYMRNARFSTYASKCIENELRMQFRQNRKTENVISLQEPIEGGKEDTTLTIEDSIPDDFCMEEAVETKDSAVKLRQMLKRLPPRDRKIIIHRYGMNGNIPLTQQETAELLGISRSYVSRLEKRVLEQLRKEFERCGHSE
jgi:RNA polymerase sporulation-specific sigma factor